MKRPKPCGSPEHTIARRQWMGGMLGLGAAAAATGIGGLTGSLIGGELKRNNRQMLILFLQGGVSQLETWDPKPGTETGGPFLTIPTSVPGTHVSELLPYTAQQMHHLCLVRGINSRENNHARGTYLMTRGRSEEPSTDYPHLGAVGAKMLEPQGASLPGFVRLESGMGPKPPMSSGDDAAYLGPKYGSLVIGDCKPIANTSLADGVTAEANQARRAFRIQLNEGFSKRRTAATDAYAYSFEQAAQLMRKRSVFDVSKESDRDRARYGEKGFGLNCLMARRLLENGVTCVQITHRHYDTHNENFNHHLEQLGEFDRPFATLVNDLAERGMLENTLVICMSEFGRTPKINSKLGRDHWGTAWSLALAGCGVQKSAVFGATNAKGTEVVEHEVDSPRLFHTFLQAVGIDSHQLFVVGGRSLPVADPASSPIDEMLL